MTKKAPSKKPAAHIPLRSFISPHSRLNRVLCGAGDNRIGCNSQNAAICLGTARIDEHVGEIPFTENSIGVMQVPVGAADHFIVNGRPTYVPVATLESGVVAGMSHAAKLCKPNGGFTAVVGANLVTAQIRYDGFGKRVQHALRLVSDLAKDEFFKTMAGLSLEKRGMRPMLIYQHTDELDGITIEVTFDTAEVMGANTVTRFATAYAKECTRVLKRRPTGIIVTNADQGPEVSVSAEWNASDLRPGVARRIVQLSRWAEYDCWRAITQNKGAMNGILGVALAAGQDVPAIAAAAERQTLFRDRHVREIGPLARFRIKDGKLHGRLDTRIPLGSVGGATHHRSSVYYRHIMCGGDSTVKELAAVIGAAGLAANFASLRMLADEGVIGAMERLLRKP